MASTNSNAIIQRLLKAEEDAEQVIKVARENRSRKLREAKTSAEDELQQFRAQEQDKLQKADAESRGDEDNAVGGLEKEIASQITQLKSNFKSNREKVAEYIVKMVNDVDLSINESTKQLVLSQASK